MKKESKSKRRFTKICKNQCHPQNGLAQKDELKYNTLKLQKIIKATP